MKFSKNWKRIIAGFMAATMVLLSVDGGCLTALAAEIQGTNIEKEMQGATGYIDIGHDAGRIEDYKSEGDLSLKTSIELPTSYSSVVENHVTSVKNQSTWGVCWAFAACAAMESYALAHGYVENPEDIDFSEYALAYLTYNDYDEENPDITGDYTYAKDEHMDELFKYGGNDEYAFKSLSNWSGIYNEPEDDTYYEDSLSSGVVKEYVENPNNISYILTGQKYISMLDTNQVKQAVIENGAVSVGYYADEKYCSNDQIYNYNYEIETSNHGVVIVGWDDSIDKSLFTTTETIPATEDTEEQVVTHTPNENGAWLVKNSWGTWDGYDGYIWISYEDLGLLSGNAVVYEVAPKDTFDNIYQHDGATVFASYCQAGKIASVFDITGDRNQMLEAVSFALRSTEANYTVSVYKITEENSTVDGELLTKASGSTTYEGYYTVEFDEPVELKLGETIAVVVGFDEIEYVVIGDNNAEIIPGYSTLYSSSELGQSYILPSPYLPDDYFVDMAGEYGYNTEQVNNVCLKAFTTDVVSVPQNVTTSITDRNKATISWNKIEDAIGYEVWIGATPSDANPTIVQLLNDEETHHTSYVIDTILGKYYFYKVAAIYEDDTSVTGTMKSEYSSAGVFQAKVPPVKNGGNNDNFYQKMIFKWNALGSIVDGYVLEMYKGSVITDENKIDTVVVEGGDVSSYVYDTSAYEAGTTINYCIYAYIEDGENRILSDWYIGPGGKTKSEPLNVAVKWHVTTIENVDYLVIDVEEFLEEGDIAQDELCLWYYLDTSASGPDYIFSLDMSDGQTQFMYTWKEHRISYEDIGYVYITNGDKTTGFQDDAMVIGGDYVEPVLETVSDVALTTAGQVVQLKAVLSEESRMENFNYSYQWYVADDASSNGTAIDGATDATYEVKIGSFDEKYYYCEVTAQYPTEDALEHVVTTVNENNEHTRVIGELFGTEVTVAPIEKVTYTGTAILPEIVVTDNNTGKPLEKGTDYEVTFSNNENVGTAVGTVKFIGDYINAPTATVYFDITPKSVETLKLSDVADVTYTGEAFTPVVTVTDKDREVVLSKDTDYVITYNANVNAGTAVITLDFKGNYTGSRFINFKISPKSADGVVISNNVSKTYTGQAIIPELILKDGESTLKVDKDYMLSCTNNINVGTATVEITFIGNYTGKQTTNFTITQKSADDLLITEIVDQEYTGGAITPEIEVVYRNGNNAVVLKKEVDYTAVYSKNINRGTASITLTFKGNYVGERTTTFNIVAKNAKNLTYGELESFDYTGEAICPSVTIKNGEVSLQEGTDFVVEYVDNIDAGTGKAIVKFDGFEGCSGNYTGTHELTFQINSKEATGCEAVLEKLADYTFTGQELRPSVIVKDGETILAEDTEEVKGDYQVTYENNINAGEARVIIKYVNNYTGETTLTFKIERKPITEADIEIEAIADQTYIGKTIIPENIVVKDKVSGIVLRPEEDYTVSAGAENTYVGTGTVIISLDLEGNYIYTGEPIEANFNIVPRDAANVTISPIPEQKYTGQEITPELEVKDGDIVLIAGVDYTITYENNIEVGTEAKVIISFCGNFKGEDKTATFTIIDPVPTSITSSVFTVSQSNGYISKITVGTTKYTLWSAFNEKEYVEIYDKVGAIVSNDKVLATGMTAGIIDEGTVTKRYTIVVTGDVNEDGMIDIADMVAVKAQILGKGALTGAKLKAGDVNNIPDGTIDIADFIRIKAHILKKDAISGVSVN